MHTPPQIESRLSGLTTVRGAVVSGAAPGAEDSAPGAENPAGVVADEQIVRRVLEGDVACFELIMRRYNQRLFRIARGILNDDHEAEDVLQETYVRAFQHLPQFEGRSKFSTWLTRIAIHEASARRRKRRRAPLVRTGDMEGAAGIEMFAAPGNHDGESEASMRELRDVLAGAVGALPDELRSVFMLRMVEGLDTDEAAECLELSSSNVKVRLHRARAMLRSIIDDRIGAEARRLYQFDGERCDRLVRAVLERLWLIPPARRATFRAADPAR